MKEAGVKAHAGKIMTRFALSCCSMALVGCQFLGPISIENGRPDYNEVIQNTSQQQLLSNVVRVHDHQPMQIMDVQQINATIQFQSSLNAQIGGIATHAQTGQVGIGSLQYQESPTIQYTPLIGQPLVQQTTTPLTPDSIAWLVNSDWPLISVLTFVADRITPGYEEYYPAIDAIVGLDEYGALVISAARDADLAKATAPISRSNPRPSATPTSSSPTSNSAPNDTLVLFLRPMMPSLDPLKPQTATLDLAQALAQKNILSLWLRLLRIYGAIPIDQYSEINSSINQESNVASLFHKLPNYIAVRTVGAASKRNPSAVSAPELKARSALGAVKAAAEPPFEMIAFVSPAEAATIREHQWNRAGTCYFYTVLTADLSLDQQDSNPAAENPYYIRADEQIENGLKSGAYNKCPITLSDSMNPASYWDSILEATLGVKRAFILIIRDSRPPAQEPYVSIHRGSEWFYIAKNDAISQRNFALLGQILTMQAVPSQTPPLSPSIIVGPR